MLQLCFASQREAGKNNTARPSGTVNHWPREKVVRCKPAECIFSTGPHSLTMCLHHSYIQRDIRTDVESTAGIDDQVLFFSLVFAALASQVVQCDFQERTTTPCNEDGCRPCTVQGQVKISKNSSDTRRAPIAVCLSSSSGTEGNPEKQCT